MKDKLIAKAEEGYSYYLNLLYNCPKCAKVVFIKAKDLTIGREIQPLEQTTYKSNNLDKFKDSLKRGTYWALGIGDDNKVIEGVHRAKIYKDIMPEKYLLCIKINREDTVMKKIEPIRFKINPDWHLNRKPSDWPIEKKKRFYDGDDVCINFYADYEHMLQKIIANIDKVLFKLREHFDYEFEPKKEINEVGLIWDKE